MRAARLPHGSPSPATWSNFAEFEAWVLSLPTGKNQGAAFEAFAAAVVRLALPIAIAGAWRPEEPGLPSPLRSLHPGGNRDIGADLLIQGHDRRAYLGQAKFHAAGRPLDKADVTAALAMSSAFAGVVFITSAETRTAPAEQVLSTHRGRVTCVMRADLCELGADFFQRWDQLTTKRVLTPRRRPPLPHQGHAVEDLVAAYARGAHRLQLHSACGTGKTTTSLYLAERLGAQRVLFFAPSLALIKQALATWTRDSARHLVALAVCSDKTVGDTEAVLDASPLDVGIPVTVSAAEAVAWLREGAADPPDTLRVVFATYHSASVVSDALAHAQVPDGGAVMPWADLLIADEAHRLAGAANRAFQIVLNELRMPAVRRLFMTATPRVVAPWVQRRVRNAGADLVSMDDEVRFGPVGHRLTFGEAIRANLLADYTVHVLAITEQDERILAAIRNAQPVDLPTGRTLAAGDVARAVALQRAVEIGVTRTAFTFHRDLVGASRFAAAIGALEAVGASACAASVIRGSMPVATRHAILRDTLASAPACVASCRALLEGVDAPAVDTVLFADPKASVIDVAQAVGRALRLDSANPAKRAAVIVPVVLPPGIDLEDADVETWAPIWATLQALRAHDEGLAEALDETRRRGRDSLVAQGGGARETDRYLQEHLVFHRVQPDALPIAFGEIRDRLVLRAVAGSSSDWWGYYGALTRFATEHGHCRTGVDFVAPEHDESLKVGIWVANQRRRQHLLTPERRAALESLPGWSWDVRAEAWLAMYTRVSAHTQSIGTSRLADRPAGRGGPRCELGTWVIQQRTQRSRLNEEQQALLEALPEWTWDPRSERWEQHLALLQAFTAREGHAQPTFSATVEIASGEVQLGRWVSKQRSRRGSLSAACQAALEALPGWTWDSHHDVWWAHHAALRKYADREGGGDVPVKHVETMEHVAYRLGSWVATQRGLRPTLPADRVSALESVPGWRWRSARARGAVSSSHAA